MTHFLYVVLDVVAQATAGPVITVPSDAVARRMFSDAVQAPGSILGTHPSDFILYKIGELDTSTGIVTPLELVPLISAQEVVDLINRSASASING